MLSPVGKKKVAGHAIFILSNVLVLALSATVNVFQDFFYIADLFPFALSIISLAITVVLLTLDLTLPHLNLPTTRAPADIGIFGVLSIFWLSFNAFSTARWREIPFQCDAIPSDFLPERLWCKSLQALKSFVWINFLVCLCVSLFTLRYTVAQYYRGNRHILRAPLSTYRPEGPPASSHNTSALNPSLDFNSHGGNDGRYPFAGNGATNANVRTQTRGSEFLQFEKMPEY